MVKPRTFITDAQWQKINYRKLVELAQDPVKAPQLVEYLDENPDLRSDLSGIYFRAKETIRKSTTG